MLSGDNSILQKSTDAKQTSERAEAKEQAQMDIMAYIADKTAKHQDASLDDEKVKDILSDNKSYVKEAGDTSFTTKKGEYIIPYSELYQPSNVTPSDSEAPTDKFATLEAKIKDEDDDCMIDENGNIMPITAWKYNINAEPYYIAGYQDDDANDISAYNGEILEDGTLQYNIPVFIKKSNTLYKITEIGELALTHLYSLKSVKIPSSITSIGYYSFGTCNNLTTVDIPDSVTKIESEAFENCEKLTSIVIPDSVTSIDDDAFNNCSSLTTIKLSNRLTSIGKRAFYSCTALTSIIIPNSVTTIGDNAFGLVNKNIITNNSSATGYPWGAR